MKTIFRISLIVSALALPLCSCSDFLEKEPLSQGTEAIVFYCCPIKILRSYKIRADFICEVSPFSLDFSRQTIKSNHGQKYTF